MKKAKVDAYLETLDADERQALELVRGILLELGMQEDLKWGRPVYSMDGINLVGFAVFKSYIGLWFFQGALLGDPHRVLVNAQEGKTQSMRQWRFSTPEALKARLEQIREYIREAGQKALNPVKRTSVKTVQEPTAEPEFDRFLDARPGLRKIFEALAPSHQREYLQYYREAKRPETRSRRLEKMAGMLLERAGKPDADPE